MKNLIQLAVLVFLFSCCPEAPQQKFYTSSDEINLTNELIKAYENQDWESYRSFFADSAKIWHNIDLDDKEYQTIDEYIARARLRLANMDAYEIDWYLNEMVVDGERGNWVYMWGKWLGKLTEDGNEITVMFHRGFLIKDGKIIEDAGFWDNLPIYLEEQRIEAESNAVPIDQE